MNSNKEKYRKLCKIDGNLPVFNQDWWLDSVCGENNWDVALVEKGGGIVGSLPYFLKKKLFFNTIDMPKLTQTMGPYIVYPNNQKYYKRLSWEKEIYTKLINSLPKYDFFRQNFSPVVSNWLPFYWKGFEQSTRYTYRIQNITVKELENVYETDIRRRRRKAENLGLSVKELYSVDDFYLLNKKTFERKGMEIPYSKKLVESIYNAGRECDAVKMFSVKLDDGTLIAANFLVYDNNTVYYLMGGIDPDKKDLGAMDLIQHHSILFALEQNKIFDFEGSMVESIEKYFRSFGAIQTPYFSISHHNSSSYTFMRNIKRLFTGK